MRSCDSQCLFSGSKGEVCSIEPLHAPPDFRDHPITHYSLLAMASLTKVHKPTQFCSQRILHHMVMHQTLWKFVMCFPFGFLSPDSGHWTKALAESLDDFSLHQGTVVYLFILLLMMSRCWPRYIDTMTGLVLC